MIPTLPSNHSFLSKYVSSIIPLQQLQKHILQYYFRDVLVLIHSLNQFGKKQITSKVYLDISILFT